LISDPPHTIHTSYIKNAAPSGATQWTVRINVTAQLHHNGENGERLISDPPHTIHTSYIKNVAPSGATQWTVRINVTAQLRHNGENLGEQLISDPPHTIHTSYIKNAAPSGATQWTVRINVTAQLAPSQRRERGAVDIGPPSHNTHIIYKERGSQRSDPMDCQNQCDSTAGGSFGRKKAPFWGTPPCIATSKYNFTPCTAHVSGLNNLKDKVQSLLLAERLPGLGRIAVLAPDDTLNEPVTVHALPTQSQVQMYTCEGAPPALRGEEYGSALQHERGAFDQQFEDTFHLSEKGCVYFVSAKAAMSNMIGGIGYFYGAGRVKSPHTRDPVPYWRAPLYTAVPSRSFFPRGFLWDEGFHGLLVARWNPSIMMDVAAHWLDLINALARVPKEFVVQSNAAANPPMLLTTLGVLVGLRPELFRPYGAHRATLSRMYPRLQAWYNWFQTTQKGEEPTSYRWRGREDDGLQLNPKSLSSGLDDYPRSLSKSSPFYMRRNTEHDPPYWRGQYSDKDGKGSGCRPFTGWTALLVLIMAEDY
ncbi:putative glucosidase i, partial [Operophtera brumata]